MHGRLTAPHVFDSHFTLPSTWNLQESPHLTPIKSYKYREAFGDGRPLATSETNSLKIHPMWVVKSEWSSPFHGRWKAICIWSHPVRCCPIRTLSPCCHHPVVVTSSSRCRPVRASEWFSSWPKPSSISWCKESHRACSSGIWCLWSWAENLLESSNMSRLYCLQFEIEGPTKVSKVQELQQGMHLFCTKTRKHTGRFMPYHCYKTSAAQRQLQGL